MNIPEDRKKTYEAIHNGIFQDEMEQAKLLREESFALFDLFKENLNPEHTKNKHRQQLEKLQEFEKSLINVELLNYLYSTIATLALNIMEFSTAIQYANAGIEANENQNDNEGIRTNRIAICNIACYMGAFKTALKILDKYPEIPSESRVIATMKSTPSENDDAFKKMLKSKKRPKSLRICLNKELRHEEKAIKTIMLHLGVSRTTALKYRRLAKNRL
jgi:hypothetical protein